MANDLSGDKMANISIPSGKQDGKYFNIGKQDGNVSIPHGKIKWQMIYQAGK